MLGPSIIVTKMDETLHNDWVLVCPPLGHNPHITPIHIYKSLTSKQLKLYKIKFINIASPELPTNHVQPPKRYRPCPCSSWGQLITFSVLANHFWRPADPGQSAVVMGALESPRPPGSCNMGHQWRAAVHSLRKGVASRVERQLIGPPVLQLPGGSPAR